MRALIVVALSLLASRVAVAANDPYAAFAAGEYRKALQGFQKRQTERPNDPELWERIGDSHYRLGNFGAARQAFRRLVELDPKWPNAFYNLGNAEARTGRFPAAVRHYKKALELDPSDSAARH
ncbi:MAG: tetratricopeptide repeat protein, partial [Myxococcota bacterium]